MEGSFNRFWAAYPRKVGQAAARRIWHRLDPSAELVEQILAAVETQRKSDQWHKRGVIPNPDKWLAGERWQDDLFSKTGKRTETVAERKVRAAEEKRRDCEAEAQSLSAAEIQRLLAERAKRI